MPKSPTDARPKRAAKPRSATAKRRPRAAQTRKVTPKGTETRATILEAAVDVINEHGYRATNLLRVARQAGLTRGGLQYYFLSTEDLIEALARHVEREHWLSYIAHVREAPAGRDRIEYAIDLVANPMEDRYRAARLELLVAARTLPTLRKILMDAAREIETFKRAFTDEMFASAGIADTPRFRGARDLTTIVDDWMFLHVFPGDHAERAAGVREALRLSLHALWSIPLTPEKASRKRKR